MSQVSFSPETAEDVEFSKWLGGVPVYSRLRRKQGKQDIKIFRSWSIPDPRDAKCLYQKRNKSSATIIRYNLPSDPTVRKDRNIFNDNNSNITGKIRLRGINEPLCANAPYYNERIKFLSELEKSHFNFTHAWHETTTKDFINVNMKVSPKKLRVSYQKSHGKQRPLGTTRSCGADVLSISDEYEDQITKKQMHNNITSKSHVRNEGFEVVPTSVRISRPVTVAHPRDVSVLENYADPCMGKRFLNGTSNFPPVSQLSRKEETSNSTSSNSLNIILPRSDADNNSARKHCITTRKCKSARCSNEKLSNNFTSGLDSLLNVGGCSIGLKVDQNCTIVTKGNLGIKSDQNKQATHVRQPTKYGNKGKSREVLEITYDLDDDDKESTVSQIGELVCLEESQSNADLRDEDMNEGDKEVMAERFQTTGTSLMKNVKDENDDRSEVTLWENRLALAGLCLSPYFNVTMSSSSINATQNDKCSLENKPVKSPGCLKGIYNMKNINLNVGHMANPEEAAKQERYRKLFGHGKSKRIVRFSVANQIHEYET